VLVISEISFSRNDVSRKRLRSCRLLDFLQTKCLNMSVPVEKIAGPGSARTRFDRPIKTPCTAVEE